MKIFRIEVDRCRQIAGGRPPIMATIIGASAEKEKVADEGDHPRNGQLQERAEPDSLCRGQILS
jgi:hypothetical protein